MKECLCNENYEALIISGNCDEVTLQDKWLSIYSEFITLSHETDVLMIKSLRANIVVLEARLAKIALCVNTLAVLGHDWEVWKNSDEHTELFNICVERLRKLNFRYEFDSNGKSFYGDLQMINSRSIEWEIQLELKKGQLEAIEAKQTGERVPTSYFTSMLVQISKHFKFSPMLRERDIMTAEYCAIKKDFVDDINKINAKNNAGKR